MGSGIAQVFAAGGYPTILFDVSPQMLTKAELLISDSLRQLTEKNKITDNERSSILSRIIFTGNEDQCRGKLVVEAIVENLDAKCTLINKLFSINAADTIIVTNTSSLSVMSIAERIQAPERFAGLHFFNPAPLMKLVEVVKTHLSSEETINFISSVSRALGKVPVICKDSPGFIVNRVARPYYLEALYLVEKGIADHETIDALMESTGFKMGPFKLMDLIGNDINYSVTSIVYEALKRPERLKPSVVQERKVKEGSLGRKSGKGYYDYPNSQ